MAQHLARLWRYGLLLTRKRHVAEELVQATCVRALGRAGEFVPGTRMDRWLLSILHSIWHNEVRSRRVRQGQGLVEADSALSFDREYPAQSNVFATQVIRRVDALPEAQRECVFLAYVEGLSYREVAEVLQVPIGTVMSRLTAARVKLAEYPPLHAVPGPSTEERR
ncbi:RNA polymerase sigma factor [Pseudomonas fluorescens]|uniref:RNA polymerase sigma factor n=1 Tax=Pseudomonas fluorescens TaxID=294 RepID=UPI00123F5F94|nr:RNA polymerase sigma factor [Pseudomonas fluorescens]